MEPVIRLKQEGREMRFEYDALFCIWQILTGFSRGGYIPFDMKQGAIDLMGNVEITLPNACRGMYHVSVYIYVFGMLYSLEFNFIPIHHYPVTKFLQTGAQCIHLAAKSGSLETPSHFLL